MSMYGSNPRLAAIGPRSNSRQDLTSPSFRNDVFVGGNGFQGDFQAAAAADGGHIYSSSFSRTSVHGGGLGGQRVYVSTGGGGGMRYGLYKNTPVAQNGPSNVRNVRVKVRKSVKVER